MKGAEAKPDSVWRMIFQRRFSRPGQRPLQIEVARYRSGCDCLVVATLS